MDPSGNEHLSGEHRPLDPSGVARLPPAPPGRAVPNVVYVGAPNDGMAVASFVLGLISLPLFGMGLILGTLAIIFGVMGRRNARRGASHKGLASWGLGFGVVSLLANIVFVVLVVYYGM